jgi:hypothetical protein
MNNSSIAIEESSYTLNRQELVLETIPCRWPFCGEETECLLEEHNSHAVNVPTHNIAVQLSSLPLFCRLLLRHSTRYCHGADFVPPAN